MVFHLGSHLGKGFCAGAAAHRQGDRDGAEQTPPKDADTPLLIENSAGAGGTMGVTLDEIQQVIDALGRPKSVGVCLDSCHLYAAGVDITDPGAGRRPAGTRPTSGSASSGCVCLHINDSAMPLGSNRDRHANVGAGLIGDGHGDVPRPPRGCSTCPR